MHSVSVSAISGAVLAETPRRDRNPNLGDRAETETNLGRSLMIRIELTVTYISISPFKSLNKLAGIVRMEFLLKILKINQ